MSVKNVSLYSLPYVVAVASILAGAEHVVPAVTSLGVPHTTTIRQTISSQPVNRALKQDRLLSTPRFLHALRRSRSDRPSQVRCLKSLLIPQLAEDSDVRFWHLADIPVCSAHVCFRGKADIPFCTAHVCF